MIKGNRYNFKGQKEQLIYMGYNHSGNWMCHQFALVNTPDKVWSEIRDDELHLIEETPSTINESNSQKKKRLAREFNQSYS